MGDSGALDRGLAALERARPLDKAGKTKEAAELYKESIACLTTALKNPGLSAASRKALAENVDFYGKRVEEIEADLAIEALYGALPEAPSTLPVAPNTAKSGSARTPGPAVAKEALGRKILSSAIALDENGTKAGWKEAGEKQRVAEAYALAAEAFISAVNVSGDSKGEKTEVYKKFAVDALSRAEELKGVTPVKPAAPAKPAQPAAAPRPRPPPRSPTRPSQGGLSTEEVGVLMESSYINGKLFMPWVAEDLQENFKFSKPWTDPDGLLPLSEPQRGKLVGWKRPSEVLSGEPKMIANVNPYSIKQDLITDCSFVASLCIASAFERRFHKQLITSIIYPQDNRRMPVYNPDGKYLVKLTINGVGRKVVVDDLLPSGERGRLLCSASQDKTELWVSIIEKAYLKVNGGYDFPGSNSGIDLFALTGWLPEQIFFEEHRESKQSSGGRSNRPQPLDNYEKAERVWERLLSAHEFGDCLITVATSELEKAEADRMGLVSSHAYAVLTVKEVQGIRLLQVKNPWSRMRWKGNYSVDDTVRWTPALKAWTRTVVVGRAPSVKLRLATGEVAERLMEYLTEKPLLVSTTDSGQVIYTPSARIAVRYDVEAAQLKDNGVFWIDFASIFQYFRNVFMNWNPALFSYRTVLHARWPVALGPKNDSFNLGYNPQFTLVVQSAGGSSGGGGSGQTTAAAAGGAAAAVAPKSSPTVWVLLSRHVTTLETEDSPGDFLTMHVYEKTYGKRVYYPHDPMFRGIYTNNPHTLIRFDLPKSTKPGAEVAYTLVVSQYEKKREVRYTVNVYCTSTFRLFATPLPPDHRKQIIGKWDDSSAGGAVGRPKFYTNPQYAMVLTQSKTKVHIQLEAPKDYQVNILVVSDGGMRIDTVPKEREAMSTGCYRPGFCYEEGILPAGTYTVIVSTFKPGQVGGFVMKIATSSPVRQPARIPAEGEGMSKQVILGRWREDDGSAAGCSNFGRYLENPRYLLTMATRTSIILRIAVPEASEASSAGRPAVNVTLFPTGLQPEDEDPSSPEGGGAVGHPIGGGKTIDPRCKPTSSVSLASSNAGVYMDAGGGAATGMVELDPGEYVAIVSSFSPQEADYVLGVFSAPALQEIRRLV